MGNMESLSAFYGVPTHAVYSATKSALFALTEALSLEFEELGIRVCDLFVAYVDSPMITASDEHVPKESRLLRNRQSWTAAEDVAEVAWSAANATRGSWQRLLHIPVNRKAWLMAKAGQVDAFLDLGLTASLMKRDVLAKVAPSKL